MVEHGALFTCDRCGATQFVADRDIVRREEPPANWSKVGVDKHLCPTCTELYNKMMNNFFAPEVKRHINLED